MSERNPYDLGGPDLTLCRGCRCRCYAESGWCVACDGNGRRAEWEREQDDWEGLMRGEEVVFDDGVPPEDEEPKRISRYSRIFTKDDGSAFLKEG